MLLFWHRVRIPPPVLGALLLWYSYTTLYGVVFLLSRVDTVPYLSELQFPAGDYTHVRKSHI